METNIKSRLKRIINDKALIASIIAISLPAIIEMGLNTLVGMADTIMISKLVGKDALSASGFANQIIFTIIFIFSSFNIGSTAMISRSHGEKDYDRLNRVVGQNITLNIIIGFLITAAVLLFGFNLMKLFDTTPVVYSLGVSYLNIVGAGQLFMFVSFAIAAILRGVEDTKTPMVITGIVNIINIIGNYILIKGIWIFPEMGISGAALSTTLSRFIGMILFIMVLLRGHNVVKLVPQNLKISSEIMRPLWKLSSMAAIEQFLLHTSFFVMSIIISVLDTTSEAAFRVLMSIESVSFMPAIGFSIAAATLVGKALGEKDTEKALHTGYISIGLGVLWGVLIGIIFIAFPKGIINIFSSEVDLIREAIPTLIIVGINQPLLAFIIIISGALRGAGDVKTVLLISAMRLWLVFIPLSYVLTIFVKMGISSIWIAEIISLSMFNLVMLSRFRGRKWAEIKV